MTSREPSAVNRVHVEVRGPVPIVAAAGPNDGARAARG